MSRPFCCKSEQQGQGWKPPTLYLQGRKPTPALLKASYFSSRSRAHMISLAPLTKCPPTQRGQPRKPTVGPPAPEVQPRKLTALPPVAPEGVAVLQLPKCKPSPPSRWTSLSASCCPLQGQ
eukprot:4463964-Amphidinium_carterae.2